MRLALCLLVITATFCVQVYAQITQDPPIILNCDDISTISCMPVDNPPTMLTSGCDQGQKDEMLSNAMILQGGCNRTELYDFLVEDPCNGMNASCSFIVTRNSPTSLPPVVIAKIIDDRVPTDPNSVLPCGSDISSNLLGRPTFFDSCDGTLQGSEMNTQMMVDTCVQRINRTFTATNLCGLSTSISQEIFIIADSTAPDITPPPTIMVMGDDPNNLPGPAVLGMANCTDECPGGVTLTFNDTVFNMTGQNTVTVERNFTCVDFCGNQATASQFIMFTANPTVSGDPHFIGFLGQKYDFHGRADQVFNLITTPDLQVNALFLDSDLIKRNKLRTYIGTIGLKTSQMQMKIGCNRTEATRFVTVDGKPLKPGHSKKIGQVHVKRSRAKNDRTVFSTPLLELSMRFSASTYSSCHINIRSKLKSRIEPYPHGVLGQTANPAKAELKGEGDQGAGIVDGEWTDYHITGNDLFGDDFTYNQYNGQQVVYDSLADATAVEGWAS